MIPRINVDTAAGVEDKFAVRQKAIKAKLEPMLKAMMAKHGLKTATITTTLDGKASVIVDSTWGKTENFNGAVIIKWLSPAKAKQTVPEYRNPFPRLRGLKCKPDGYVLLYGTPSGKDFYAGAPNKLSELKAFVDLIPRFLAEMRGAQYQHSGD